MTVAVSSPFGLEAPLAVAGTSERANDLAEPERTIDRMPVRTRLNRRACEASSSARGSGSLAALMRAVVSRKMQEVISMVGRLASSNVTVTLLGETGTGKDVFAHLIHENGSRSDKPFVVFDCGAVPANLIESELFGHERGSFTGAVGEHPGAFERARGGTVFLDEIGELPLELQSRLLRVLDSQSVRRIGGTCDRKVDVRVIAATNRNLAALVSTRGFRRDLYFRLAAAVVCLPPLRERLEDLPMLVGRLLSDLGRPEMRVPATTLELLHSHPWPGNVRELKNVLACALAFVDDSSTLEPHYLRMIEPLDENASLEQLPLGGHSLVSLERAAIKQTLAQVHGNRASAARLLGVATSTLYEKMKKYGIARSP